MIRCPVCGGVGTLELGEVEMVADVHCWMCDGEGRVVAETMEEL